LNGDSYLNAHQLLVKGPRKVLINFFTNNRPRPMSFFNPFRGTPSKEPGKPKAPAAGTGSPLELISYDTQTGKFQLGSKALEVLRSVSI